MAIEFRIIGNIGENPDTVDFKNFMREVEIIINSDSHIIDRAKKANAEFTEQARKILENPENSEYAWTMLAGLKSRMPSISFLKKLEHSGRNYEAEIDYLNRVFYLHEI